MSSAKNVSLDEAEVELLLSGLDSEGNYYQEYATTDGLSPEERDEVLKRIDRLTEKLMA